MPYTLEHKRNSRERILNSAWKLFSRRGFDQVSIDDLMRDAGMTRGAFYNHFETKSELYREAILSVLGNNRLHQVKPDNVQDEEGIKYLIRAYLSRVHIDKEPAPCPLAFLVTDMANREPQVRNAYTQVYRELIKMMEKQSGQDRDVILAITAMMIGSVAIGRALDDDAMVDRLLVSSRKVVESLIDGV